MTASDDELIEKIARAMCIADEIDPDFRLALRPGAASVPMWKTREEAVIAALAVARPVIWNEAIEEAAKKADSLAKGYGAYRDHFQHRDACITAAAVIRALKKKKETK